MKWTSAIKKWASALVCFSASIHTYKILRRSGSQLPGIWSEHLVSSVPSLLDSCTKAPCLLWFHSSHDPSSCKNWFWPVSSLWTTRVLESQEHLTPLHLVKPKLALGQAYWKQGVCQESPPMQRKLKSSLTVYFPHLIRNSFGNTAQKVNVCQLAA